MDGCTDGELDGLRVARTVEIDATVTVIPKSELTVEAKLVFSNVVTDSANAVDDDALVLLSSVTTSKVMLHKYVASRRRRADDMTTAKFCKISAASPIEVAIEVFKMSLSAEEMVD